MSDIKAAKEDAKRRRERMWQDAKTKQPRVVLLTEAEARTLERSNSATTGKRNYCMQCGHLPLFHHGSSLYGEQCHVDGCTCEVWDEERAARHREYERNLERSAMQSWFGRLLGLKP